MQSNVLIIKAEVAPVIGVERPSPNQIYRNVHMYKEEKSLGNLHPDAIRLKMSYVGICGTDVHLTMNHPKTGYICCSSPLYIPQEGRVIGHEGVGQIIEVGKNIKHLTAGMYVALESIVVCNQCSVCKKGRFNQCLNAKLVGLEVDGLLGDIVDVPASLGHDLSEYVRNEKDLIAAANVEPAGVAFVGCVNAQIQPGDRVAIFGAGPIGLLSAMLSKQIFGASEVHVIDPSEFRRNFSKKWADYIYDVEEFFKMGPNSIDVVLEASAVLENVSRVFNRIHANGRVVLLGRQGEPLDIRHVDHMITNEITIKGSRGHLGGAFEKVMKLHHSGRINLHDIVTSTVHGIDGAMNVLQDPSVIVDGNCKVIVDMTQGKSKNIDLKASNTMLV